MALIDLIDVSKKFGTNEIFNSINFSVNDGEKIAVIGKNGSGKSTLMKLLLGVEQADSGRYVVQNNLQVQMLVQSPKFDDSLSVKDALNLELKEIFDAIKKYEILVSSLAKNTDDKDLHREQDELIKFIESKDGWNIEHKIERILAEFKLKEYENRNICHLSLVNICLTWLVLLFML